MHSRKASRRSERRRDVLGFLASTVLSPRKRRPVREPTTTIEELRALLDRHEETTAELRARSEQLETAQTAVQTP